MSTGGVICLFIDLGMGKGADRSHGLQQSVCICGNQQRDTKHKLLYADITGTTLVLRKEQNQCSSLLQLLWVRVETFGNS